MLRSGEQLAGGAQPTLLRNDTFSRCSCPTPGSAGCPAWCTRRALWSCVPWSACEGWCAKRCAPRCCQSAEWFRAKVRGLGVAAAAPEDMGPPRTRRDAAEGGGRMRRVMVWQGERNEDGHLSFMYCCFNAAYAEPGATELEPRWSQGGTKRQKTPDACK